MIVILKMNITLYIAQIRKTPMMIMMKKIIYRVKRGLCTTQILMILNFSLANNLTMLKRKPAADLC